MTAMLNVKDLRAYYGQVQADPDVIKAYLGSKDQ